MGLASNHTPVIRGLDRHTPSTPVILDTRAFAQVNPVKPEPGPSAGCAQSLVRKSALIPVAANEASTDDHFRQAEPTDCRQVRDLAGTHE
jgi:hypothetical protein